MENQSLRKSMGMTEQDSGVLVARVFTSTPAYRVLQKGDIVTSIDGVPISKAGTVPYGRGGRVSFHHLVTMKSSGKAIVLDILRDGERQSLQYKVRANAESALVPVYESQQPE